MDDPLDVLPEKACQGVLAQERILQHFLRPTLQVLSFFLAASTANLDLLETHDWLGHPGNRVLQTLRGHTFVTEEYN